MSPLFGTLALKQAVDYFAAHIFAPRASDFVPLLQAYCREQKTQVDGPQMDRFLVLILDGLKVRNIRLDALVVDRLRYDTALLLGLPGPI